MNEQQTRQPAGVERIAYERCLCREPHTPSLKNQPPKITMSLLSFGVTRPHVPIRPEHASAKSHVQTPRYFCITTGAATHARIVH
jgi:hypothetical protein